MKFKNIYGDKLDFGAMKVARYLQVNKLGAQTLQCFEGMRFGEGTYLYVLEPKKALKLPEGMPNPLETLAHVAVDNGTGMADLFPLASIDITRHNLDELTDVVDNK